MREKPLGPGAGSVSAVGYGGMHLSIDGRPPEDIALRVIHASLDAGVTLIDTADVYCLSHLDIGHNERLIAKALSTWKGPRENLIVATKGGMERPDGRWTSNARPDHLLRACDRSLTALGVERIDLYQLHAPDPRVPFQESIGALVELVNVGKVRWLGLSNVAVEQIDTARKITPITSVQNRLNPFFREALDEGVVEYCDREGLGFLAYSPTGGGRLNLKLPSHPVVKKIAERRRISPHAVVLAWVLAQGTSVIVIPSARTVAHAEDSARAAEVELDEEELDDIDAAEFSIAR
jgi:aryl-alcohol dehydrogenase-like predicted oxidoreductase